jgi:protein involved in ribonucleotide reduction
MAKYIHVKPKLLQNSIVIHRTEETNVQINEPFVRINYTYRNSLWGKLEVWKLLYGSHQQHGVLKAILLAS